MRSRGAYVLHLGHPDDATALASNGSITFASSDSRAVLVLSDRFERPTGKRPALWLDLFRSKDRAVNESYVRALADVDFDFDSVERAPHLAYEPKTYTPRPI